jgi:hypothetical protein
MISLDPESSRSNSEDQYRPIPELRPPANDVLAVMLIKNDFVTHLEKMDDPVFQAQEYDGGGRWHNGNFSGSVLACIDKAIICEPNNDTCTDLHWDNDAKYMIGTSFEPAIRLLAFAVSFSTTALAIAFRGGSGLNAQSRMAMTMSLPLSQEQWKVEAGQLFQISLARIQIYVRGIAQGIGSADLEGPDLMDTDILYRDMCHVVKFRSVGWRTSALGVSIFAWWAACL